MDADVISIVGDWSARDVRKKRKKTVRENIEKHLTKNATLRGTEIETFETFETFYYTCYTVIYAT